MSMVHDQSPGPVLQQPGQVYTSHAQYSPSQAQYSQPGQVYSQPGQVYSQPQFQYSMSNPVQVAQPVQMTQMQRTVPKCFFDVRTVLVPKSIVEDYTVMETRVVAISIPVPMQRQRIIEVPRFISIPRPMIEKRLIKKMVPKVIQVEEQYEIEIGMTEMQMFFSNADTDGSGGVSYSEWAQANNQRGVVDANALQQSFAQKDTDGDGQLSLSELSASGALPQQAMQPA
mmetsp:Transcript_93537/g.136632  ORF Transcript_93537/g.136632 Transcript_93537/m.136632 type:complete len:228 (-) Transcript_93537:297-980(-)